MQVTSKGQITIPQEIREKMGFLPSTRVRFVLRNNRVYLEKEKTPKKFSRGKKIVERMRGKATVKLTTDEILALTRDK